MWQAGEIGFDLDESATAHPTVTVVCRTPAGEVRVMADIVRTGRVLVVSAAHIQGLDANRLGVGGLIALARAFVEAMDVDELVVQGAVRSTGRGAGRRPRPFRYRRR